MSNRTETASWEQFRAGRTVRTVTVAGAAWRVLRAGSGPGTVLLLPGGTGQAEAEWQAITALEPHVEVVAVSYPLTHSLDDLVAGLVTVLDAEGLDTFPPTSRPSSSTATRTSTATLSSGSAPGSPPPAKSCCRIAGTFRGFRRPTTSTRCSPSSTGYHPGNHVEINTGLPVPVGPQACRAIVLARPRLERLRRRVVRDRILGGR